LLGKIAVLEEVAEEEETDEEDGVDEEALEAPTPPQLAKDKTRIGERRIRIFFIRSLREIA
jgi:hypothetical protein